MGSEIPKRKEGWREVGSSRNRSKIVFLVLEAGATFWGVFWKEEFGGHGLWTGCCSQAQRREIGSFKASPRPQGPTSLQVQLGQGQGNWSETSCPAVIFPLT